jgi:predicted alpha/beta-fold hydrolase
MRFPDLAPEAKIAAISTLEDFDNLITGPLHGFVNAQDYYARSSSLKYLKDIRLRTLLFSAVDDPMLPPVVLEEVREIARGNPALEIDFVAKGGHAGFVSGSLPWRPFYYAEHHVGEFFARQFERSARVGRDEQRKRG